MQDLKLIFDYSTEVLSFSWKNNEKPTTIPPLSGNQERAVERTLKILGKKKADNLVVFGLGSGGFASEMQDRLPTDTNMFVCELDTQKAKAVYDAGRLSWWSGTSSRQLLADSSPWAHLHLLTMLGVDAGNSCLILNPEASPEEKEQLQNLQRMFHQIRIKNAFNSPLLSHVATQPPSLAAAAILSPDEPNLDRFFDQFPAWLEELVIVWDSREIPDVDLRTSIPVRQIARPLGNDFAAQRNAMLEACKADWIIYLDGDETLSDDVWDLFPGLLLAKISACYLPRTTYFPDEKRVRVGLGLWPDLQLRLFKNAPGLKFENTVHERLTGVRGAVGLLLDGSIRHWSHLDKKPEQLKEKLALFDQAGKGSISHTLSSDYPNLPAEYFPDPNSMAGVLRIMVLPENPAKS